MFQKNHFFIILISTLMILIIAAGLVLKFAAPKIEQEIRGAVKQECDSCDFQMDEASLTIRGIEFTNVKLSGGNKGGQFFAVEAKSISGNLITDSLTIHFPKVVFLDGDLEPPATKNENKNEEPTSPKKLLRRVFIEGGSFKYIRDTKGTHAELVVSKINAEIDPNPNLVRARTTAQIGNSGSLQLIIETPIQKQPLEVDVLWKVRNQDFKALSQFFKPNAGVELNGTLVKGDAVTKLRGKKLTSSLTAEYKDFTLRVHKLYDRNEVQAFFTNLGASVAISVENTDKTKEQKSKTVELERESDESIVSFILRGLKESALAIAI